MMIGVKVAENWNFWFDHYQYEVHVKRLQLRHHSPIFPVNEMPALYCDLLTDICLTIY